MDSWILWLKTTPANAEEWIEGWLEKREAPLLKRGNDLQNWVGNIYIDKSNTWWYWGNSEGAADRMSRRIGFDGRGRL